jgi:hypothetical protein
MMTAKYLWIFGSVVITVLGTIHLIYTFCSNKFSPGDEKLADEMKMSSPVLTRQTTMWKASKGFNATHCSGAMFIGIINLYLAVKHFIIFQSDNFFFLFNMLTIGFCVWLAKKYWFNIPLTGILITFICFIISFILSAIIK